MSKQRNFTRTAIVVALSAIFPASVAYAEDEVEALINPNTAEVAFKLPYTDKINPLYRQYNGVNHKGLNGNVDIDVVNRVDDVWFKLKAENLGLSTQEFGVSYEKQGDWAIGLNYNQIPRYNPYEVWTAVSGADTNTIRQPDIASTDAAQNNPNLKSLTLKTERDITTLTASKYLLDGLKFSFSFKNEDKTGVRMDGVRGSSSSATTYSGFLFAPEPINQNHKQFEAVLDYVTGKYQLSVGYYGSFLKTKNNALNIVDGTNTAAVAGLTPIALAPDNLSQQFYINGAYNFSADTRANLKLAYAEGRQDDSFVNVATGQLSPLVGSSLDGKVRTTEVFGSVTSRITNDLKLLGSWRYEHKEDKTPVRNYSSGYVGPVYSSFVTNNPESHTANWGKLEADYRLAKDYAVTVGADYTSKTKMDWKAVVNNAGNSYQNPEYEYGRSMSELTSRLAFRKTMSETLNGTVTIAHSDRKGSEDRLSVGATAPPQYPVYLADRKRDKVRGMVDWSAAENLNLQVGYEAYFDNYENSSYGLDKGNGQVLSLDGSYVLNDAWKLNAWYSKQIGDTTQYAQGGVCLNATCATTTPRSGVALVQWSAQLKSNSSQFGVGVTGKIRAVDIGMQYLYSRDENQQKISAMPDTATSGMGVLPDTQYTQHTLKVFGVYPLAKSTKLRLDYIYDIRKMDDYTWSNWVFADGTRVFVKPEQTTQVLGLTLIQSF